MAHQERFLLRLNPDLMQSLREQAKAQGVSINTLIRTRLEALANTDPGKSSLGEAVLPAIQGHFKDKLLGLVFYGSRARGEGTEASDTDVLVIVDGQLPIDRGLYESMDRRLTNRLPANVALQVVHLPSAPFSVSNLWLEVALEGIVLFDPTAQVRHTLTQLKALIAEGRFQRKMSYGQPYWVERRP